MRTANFAVARPSLTSRSLGAADFIFIDVVGRGEKSPMTMKPDELGILLAFTIRGETGDTWALGRFKPDILHGLGPEYQRGLHGFLASVLFDVFSLPTAEYEPLGRSNHRIS